MKGNFRYFFREGSRNMFSHGFMSFAAIGVTVACLLIMGTFTLVAYNANENLADLQRENAIVAFVDETLEESEFGPMFDACKEKLAGKDAALFGSYGWGDGQWMRDWEDRAKSDGAALVADGLIAHLAPEADDLENCRHLAAAALK